MWWIIGVLIGIATDKTTKEERARKQAEEDKQLLPFMLIISGAVICFLLYVWHLLRV
jgi:hypothetical protein